MAINSVLSTGIDGVKHGIRTAQNAAQDIASATVAGNIDTGNPGAVTPPVQDNSAPDTLTEAIVSLKKGEHQVKASAAVVKTADQMLGTLVDIKV